MVGCRTSLFSLNWLGTLLWWPLVQKYYVHQRYGQIPWFCLHQDGGFRGLLFAFIRTNCVVRLPQQVIRVDYCSSGRKLLHSFCFGFFFMPLPSLVGVVRLNWNSKDVILAKYIEKWIFWTRCICFRACHVVLVALSMFVEGGDLFCTLVLDFF